MAPGLVGGAELVGGSRRRVVGTTVVLGVAASSAEEHAVAATSRPTAATVVAARTASLGRGVLTGLWPDWARVSCGRSVRSTDEGRWKCGDGHGTSVSARLTTVDTLGCDGSSLGKGPSLEGLAVPLEGDDHRRAAGASWRHGHRPFLDRTGRRVRRRRLACHRRRPCRCRGAGRLGDPARVAADGGLPRARRGSGRARPRVSGHDVVVANGAAGLVAGRLRHRRRERRGGVLGGCRAVPGVDRAVLGVRAVTSSGPSVGRGGRGRHRRRIRPRGPGCHGSAHPPRHRRRVRRGRAPR